MFKFSFSYSASFLRRYYFSELWRTQGGWLVAVPLAIAVLLWAWREPDLGPVSGFFIGLAAAYALILVSSYRRVLTEMSGREVHATVTESDLQFDVASVTSTAPWAAIRSARKTSHAIILQTRLRGRPIVIPLETLSAEVSAFIMKKATGGSTRDGA